MKSCAQAEQSLLGQVRTGDPHAEEVREALESLLDGLLATLGGLGPRPTDGLTIRRQEISRSALWALGTAYMLDGADHEPVWVEFTFDPARDAIASAQVLFGIRDTELAGVRRSKLEDLLLGYPHETKSTVPWREAFTRDASGWKRMEWS